MEKSHKKHINELGLESDDDSDDNDNLDLDENLKKMKNKVYIRKSRVGISAEVYGELNKRQNFVAKVVQKTKQQKEQIRKKCMENFMFNSLDKKEMDTVIDAFEEVKKKEGETIIKQGEKGDVLYLVEKGELDCSKVIKGENKFLKKYYPGDSFGELALLYNAPRAATIVAKKDCLLWALDRECFNCIVKDSTVKKREKYDEILQKVEVLRYLDKYELTQISDAAFSQFFPKGEYIIKEGDYGDKFYILIDGKAYATKSKNGKEILVLEYSSGDYFGELALSLNQKRAASIVAQTDCNVLVLDKNGFNRILGPIENILKKRAEKYVKV